MGFFTGHLHPFVLYRPAYRRSQAHNRPERGRFTHAVSAQKRYDLSPAYLQRNIEKNMALPIIGINFVNL
jgi:hypothetical protein